MQIPSFLELERPEWCINCIIMENTMPKKPKKVKSIRYFHVKKGYELFQNFGLGIYFCHSNFGNSTAKLTWGWGRLCEGLLITSSKSSSKSSASSNSLLRSVKRPSLPWPRGTVPPNTLVSWKKNVNQISVSVIHNEARIGIHSFQYLILNWCALANWRQFTLKPSPSSN